MTSYLAPHDTIVCHVEKLQMWINDTFFLLPNFAPHDKFTMYAVLSWFTLFWRKIHFVAIYALLCGANINPKILSAKMTNMMYGLNMFQPTMQWCYYFEKTFLHFFVLFGQLFHSFSHPCLRSQHGPPYNAARYFLDVSILTFGGTLFLHSPPVSTQSQIVRLLQHALNKNGYYEVVLCGEAVLPIYTNHCTCSANCTAHLLHLTWDNVLNISAQKIMVVLK